jgi:hypothetical protein
MNYWTSLVDPRSAMPPGLVAYMRAESEPVDPPAPPVSRIVKARQARFEKSYRCQLLRLLQNGSMDRRDFWKLAHQLAKQCKLKNEDAVSFAVKTLLNEGLLVCEMKLTAKGLDKLGLKGPQ